MGLSVVRRVETAESPAAGDDVDGAFFERVERGYEEVCATEPARVRRIDGARGMAEVAEAIEKK